MPRGSAIGRWPFIGAVLLAGAAATAIVAAIPDGAFLSGDGGLKYLAARQFAEGTFSTDLRLPAEPWVQAEWARGAYPFDPPFVYEADGRRLPAFPPWFPLLSAPFLALFGWWGLFVIPAGAVIWTAVEVDAFLRRRVSPGARRLGVATLVLATPLALYGAMFWEHALACALSAAGLVRLFDTAGARRARPFLAGALLGLAGWLRPEMFALAAVVLAVARPVLRPTDTDPPRAGPIFRVSRWDAAALGTVAVVGAWALANLVLFGSPAGVHGLQVTGIEGPGRWWMVRTVAAALLPLPFLYAPVTIVAAVLGLAALHPAVRRRLPDASALAAIAILFPLAACLVVPNDGGKQWGPRYFLGALVPAVLAATMLFDRAATLGSGPRWTIRLAVVAAALAGATWNARGAAEIARDYATRVAPVLEVVRQDAGRPIVVDLDWTALEIARAAGDRPVLRVRDPEALRSVVAALDANGISGFLYVAMKVGDVEVRTAPFLDGSAGLRCTRAGESDALVAWDCERVAVTRRGLRTGG